MNALSSEIIKAAQNEELNGLVAEHLLRWTQVGFYPAVGMCQSGWMGFLPPDEGSKEYYEMEPWLVHVPESTTDANAALKVVAAMSDRNFACSITVDNQPGEDFTVWHQVAFTFWPNNQESAAVATSFSDSFPRAICEAALSAKLLHQDFDSLPTASKNTALSVQEVAAAFLDAVG